MTASLGNSRRRRHRLLLVAFFCALGIPPARGDKSPNLQLPGYLGVPVHYSAFNKMLMRASINGHPATMIIDTGAGVSILEAKRAQPWGVTPVGRGSPFGERIFINGQALRVGFINSLKAGPMDFGGGPIALFDSNANNSFFLRSRIENQPADGVLGEDILTRYKAIINCRTRYIFFKIDATKQLHLVDFTAAQKFTRVAMRQETNRAFTVPCAINGKSSRLLVDTGAFLTTFDQPAAKALGISLHPTSATGRFSDGIARQISLGKFSQLTVGDFKVPPQKLAAAVLPSYALQQGSAHVDGILGMELLAFNNAIIDFDSMSLFLK